MRRISVVAAVSLVAAILAVSSPAGAAGPIIYVDEAATGVNNGSSWTDAFTDLQDALAVASSGDDVHVAAGTYIPHLSDPAVSFELRNGVDVIGGFPHGGGPFDPVANLTVLSGDLAGDDSLGLRADNADSVVSGDAALTEPVTLQGVTISGGDSTSDGAGMHLTGAAQVSLDDVTVTDNVGGTGAGIHVTNTDRLLLRRSQVTGNTTLVTTYPNDTAGIAIVGSEVMLVESSVSNNTGDGIFIVEFNLPGAGADLRTIPPGIDPSDGAAVVKATRDQTIAAYEAAGLGIDFFEPGRLVGIDAEVNGNTSDGITMVSAAYVDLRRSQVNGNGGSGLVRELSFGSLRAEETEISENGGTGLFSSDGSFELRTVTMAGNGGYGIYTIQSDPHVWDSTFAGNGNSGIRIGQSRMWLTGVRVTGNQGGGISGDGRGYENAIIGSEITGNTSPGDGGGLRMFVSDLRIENTVIADNVAAGSGGGALFEAVGSNVRFTNVTITGNSATSGPGIFMEPDAFWDVAAEVRNSIVWGNSPSGPAIDGSAIVEHSDVEGWTGPGTSNIDVDPLFASSIDRRLQPTSPARDAGDSAAVAIDTSDIDEDGDTSEVLPDLDGNERIQGAAVDMGAYESAADITDPMVSLVTPADGVVFVEGQIVIADYVCADVGSGMASCVGDVADGAPIDTTATVGAKTFTVIGIDNAGNTTVVTHNYTVEPLPVVVPGVVNVTEGDDGTRVADVPLTLSAPVGFEVTVDWSTLEWTATAPDDYLAASGTVTFAPGETTKTVPITVNSDVVFENDEVFVVGFTNATNATIGGFWGLGIVIINDDDPQPTVSAGTFAANPEGDSGSTFWDLPVTLSAPAGVPVTVDWNTLDIASSPLIAHPGSDYVGASGTLTFAPGETVKNIPIEILGDTDDEPPLLYGEWGLVQLSNPVNTTITGGFFGFGLFIIIDDD